jgi:glycosyltransferase involved in cell wall biosynthesis
MMRANLAGNYGSGGKRKVLILAPFLGPDGCWIDDFCDRRDLEFEKAPYLSDFQSWHSRGATTPLSEWLAHFKFARRAMKKRCDCIVTAFPQQALVAAVLLLLMGRSTTRLIAWSFNLGSLPSGWKRHLARLILKRVDRFVVHARAEIGSYSRWLDVDEDKFRFIPLQRGDIEKPDPSPIAKPYIVSMGSAHRDYGTLVEAVTGTGIKTVIIGKKDMLDLLPENADLIKLHGISLEECNSILSEARVNVVPITDTQTASGQVTFTTSMRMGIATVATRCIGTIDYMVDGETGVLVPLGDPKALNLAIDALWRDEALRTRIGRAGREYADRYFSDEAAGANLGQVINEVLS